MTDRDKRSWLAPATISLVLIPTAAGASGFALLEQSASRLGTAFAGTAVAADGSIASETGSRCSQTRPGLAGARSRSCASCAIRERQRR